jgi:CTD kinase subunit alpha
LFLHIDVILLTLGSLQFLEGDWHEFESKALRKENERRDKEARRLQQKEAAAAREKEKKRAPEEEAAQREAKRQQVTQHSGVQSSASSDVASKL